jgi:hypothetical protein
MKAVLIQLAHKAREITVFIYGRQHLFSEFGSVMDSETLSILRPRYNAAILLLHVFQDGE